MFIGTAQVVRHAKEGINPQRLIPNLVRAKSGMALYLYILCMYKIHLFVHVPCLIVALFFFLNLQVTKRTESHQFNKFKYSQCFSTLVLGLIMHQQNLYKFLTGKGLVCATIYSTVGGNDALAWVWRDLQVYGPKYPIYVLKSSPRTEWTVQEARSIPV